MTVVQVHVRPLPGGQWGIHLGERSRPECSYRTASDAERAAFLLLAGVQCAEVVVHDLYHRRRTFAQRSPGRTRL